MTKVWNRLLMGVAIVLGIIAVIMWLIGKFLC
jgi:hypothetical protein